MQVAERKTCVLILILIFAAVFLVSQFHYCCDLMDLPSASHICPLCSDAGSIVAAESPVISVVPVTNRLELAPVLLSVWSAGSRATAPPPPPPPQPSSF